MVKPIQLGRANLGLEAGSLAHPCSVPHTVATQLVLARGRGSSTICRNDG